MRNNINNALYHFTTFESAVKIVSSQKLLFGRACRKNDIAEVYKEIIGNMDNDAIQKALGEYQYLSFITNSESGKGFEQDALWGYYAEKGLGVCLAFDREKLVELFSFLYPNIGWHDSISYNPNCTNAHFIDCNEGDDVHSLISNKIKELFFEKSIDWKHESEYRLLVKSPKEASIDITDNLLGVIICDHCSKKDKLSITDTIQYKVFSKLIGVDKLYHYHHCFGNKELYNHNDSDIIYPIWGKDITLDV